MSQNEIKLRLGEESRCEDVRLAMGEVLDGVADQVVKGAVEAHVRTCPPCSREMDELRVVVDGVKQLAQSDPPPQGWKRVESAAGGPRSTKSAASPGFWIRLRNFFFG